MALVACHIRFAPTRSASRPSGTDTANRTSAAIDKPSPTCWADSPTMTVKKTALPVRNAPSPNAESTDWPAKLRTSGVGPTILVARSRSRRTSVIGPILAQLS